MTKESDILRLYFSQGLRLAKDWDWESNIGLSDYKMHAACTKLFTMIHMALGCSRIHSFHTF